MNAKLSLARSLGMLCLLTLSGVALGEEKQAIRVTCTLPDGPTVLAECPDLPSAQRKLRELRRQGKLGGPVDVVLGNGTYSISEPLRFTPEDAGTAAAPVTYRAETPGAVTISGGVRIDGWRPEAGGVWRADVPDVRAGRLYFRQMFVNGRRAVRARSPNQGFFYAHGLITKPEYTHGKADGFYYAHDDMTEEFANDPDTLLVIYESWLASQHRVKEFRPKSKSVITEHPMAWSSPRSRFVVENARPCLDAAGEWYLERRTGVVRYIPLPGEDMGKATVIVPVTPSLLQFHGDPQQGKYVEHLHFTGLIFTHADWTPQGRSLTGGQARCPTGFEAPDVALESGAISAIGLRHASIEDCEIAQVGAHAVVLMQGCTDNTVRKCHMHDLGGGGVYLFWETPDSARKWKPRGDFDCIERNEVDNCFIHDLTYVWYGSVGALLGPCAANNRITHNEICYGDYTGISVGWGWSADQKYGFHQDGNVVEDNHVHHVMNYLLDDGAAIYLLGWQKGTRICRNWIHDVRSYSGGYANGLYPDSGTSGVLFEGNVIHDVLNGFAGNGGHECIVRNNIFAYCLQAGIRTGGHWWDVQVNHNPNPIVVERNIVYNQGGSAAVVRTGNGPDAQVSRQNIYWPGAERAGEKLFSGQDARPVTFAEWQAAGYDTDSSVADPLFADAAARDFRLPADSPALKMGFVPTDLSKVGLYGDSDWTSLPRRTTHAPVVPLPGPAPRGIVWTYEDEVIGVAPTDSGQLAPGPAELQHRIAVTDADAASGKHCLLVVEGKNDARSFFPFLHESLGVGAGSVRASLQLKMPAAKPSAMCLEFRDYVNTGLKYYQTGPHLEIDAHGVLTASANVKIPLPRDTWIRLDLAFDMTPGAAKAFDLTVTAPGQSPRAFRQVPYTDIGFLMASEIYIISGGPDGGAFMIDDVRVEIVQNGRTRPREG